MQQDSFIVTKEKRMVPTIIYHKATPEGVRGKDGFFRRVLNFPDLPMYGIAEVHVNERYPAEGYAFNPWKVANRVLTGNFYLYIRGQEAHFFSKGEMFFIPEETPYYIIPELPTVYLEISEPAWNADGEVIVTFS